MTDGIKIEWEEPGPATWTRMLVEYGPEYDHRDPTESDLTRALELLAPEVKRRILGKAWEEEYERANRFRAQGAEQYQARLQAERDRDAAIAELAKVKSDWKAHWEMHAATDEVEFDMVVKDCRRAERERDDLRAKLSAAEKERDEAVEKKPKLSADDITAALWDMPGKERAVVMYPFWPAISEAAQRTHLADEKATAAMADAHLARVVLNDCRRVLTKAENDRDVAMGDRDATNGLQQKARVVLGAGSAENVLVASRRVVAERDEACKERDLAHIAAHEAEQQRDRYRGGHEAAYKKIGQLTEERDAAIGKLEAVRRAAK